MKKHKKQKENKLLSAINNLPNPIEDKRHNIFIYFIDDRARSNETRFEHIIDSRHELFQSDIKRIPRLIKTAIFKKDKERKDTFNLYLKRNSFNNEFIKISVRIVPSEPHKAIVRTIFIAKTVK